MNKVKVFEFRYNKLIIENELNRWLKQNDGIINPISISTTEGDDGYVIVYILYELLEQE